MYFASLFSFIIPSGMENTSLTADQLQHLAVLLAASPFPPDVKALLPQLIATASPEQLSQLYALVVEAEDAAACSEGDAPARIAAARHEEATVSVSDRAND